mmetsp:Transcript_20318/g.44399  ORF Transcript_20318/g.44399 Transcript_20318/m.44399 type:complete len:478 (-) Transcript_20318:229-1662(-)
MPLLTIQPTAFSPVDVAALSLSEPVQSTYVLARDSYASAKRRRTFAKKNDVAVPENYLLLRNCRVLDPESATVSSSTDVLIQNGKIVHIGPEAASLAGELYADIHCGGHVLMPGLCDAHVHCTAITANLAALMSHPESYVTARAAEILCGMIARGFTTIRDAGGADFGLAQAVEEGVVLGPRLLFTGHALSQTGGHGDFRGRGEDMCACGAALRGIGRVCDGDAEVRRAARDELRKGAHCIKIMASGGVASPTDRLTSNQFSLQEIKAIVEEAQACGTYVCAHAYMPPAIQRAVLCGVRSIEHGNYLDEETARMMAVHGALLVPTLVTYQKLKDAGEAAGMPAELVSKVGSCVDQGLEALQVAHAAGVTMCFGSDLLGDLHGYQSEEFAIRARKLPAADIIRAATVNCAQLFGLQTCIGKVAVNFDADLILVEGDPLADITELSRPERHVKMVIKEGLVVKGPRGHCFEDINYVLVP